MSSFTPKEIRGLYSAYAEVHMTEEDRFASSLLEEINYVINDMVEEGWDLSEYTWEELQESFLDAVILPEIERFTDVVSQLNESNEELTEEQQEEFILEWNWLTAITNIGRAKKAADVGRSVATATKTAQAAKPNILQAPLVGSKPSVPAASTAPLQAPVKPVKPTKPLPPGLSSTGGATQAGKPGLYTQVQNWVGGLFKAKPPAAKPTAAPAAAKPPATPAAAKPIPSGPRLSDRIGAKLSQGLKALTAPAPRPHGPLKSFGGAIDKVFGTTKRGLAARTVAATDAYGQLAYPDKNPYSLTGLAAGALTTGVGAALQGVAGAERFGQKGPDGKFFGRGAYETGQRFGLGYAARDAGERLTKAGLGMIAQNDSSKQTPPPAETEAQRRRRLNLPPTSLTQQTQSFEMSGKTISEEPKWPTQKPKGGDWSKLTIGGITKIWDPETKSYQLPGTINKRLKAQGESQISVPGRVSGYKSPAQIKAEAEAKAKAKAEAEAKAKAEAEAKAQPAPAQPDGGGSTPAPAPAAPAAPAPAAPKPSPVADYMKAAAAARKSGDPAEMAKVRDMGMEIWRKSNTKLAAASAERERIRGTAQTDNPLMKDMRDRLPVTPTVQAPAVKDLGSGQQSLAQNKFAGRSPEPAKPAPAATPQVSAKATPEMNNVADELSKNPLGKKKEEAVKKEAYDIVLDYIFAEGHADTLSEAHYVMMQMDAEYIQSIVEGFPVTGTTKTDPAEKLRLRQDSSGRKYYVGPGGREMSPQDVNKVMSGQLMVKGGKKESKPTTQVAHFEPEGEVIDERLIDKLNPNNSVAAKAQNTSPFSRPTTPLPSYTSPFAKPGSRDDSGKLTTYGAGGGAAAERAGKPRDEVMRQGAKNLENKKPKNQGPDFGR